MRDLNVIQQSWSAATQTWQQTRDALQTERQPLAAQVAAFHAEEADGMLKRLSRAFTKAVKIKPLERKVNALDGKIADADTQIKNTAEDTYRQLGEFSLTSMTGADDLRVKYDRLAQTQEKLTDARAKVSHAIAEAEDASGWEMVDMVGGNAGFSLLSYLETDEAKEAIRDAGASLKSLNAHLLETQKMDPQLVSDLGFGNTLDLFVDMAGGFMGAITSYMNMQKLDEAVAQLGDISTNLDKIKAEVTEGQRAIQTTAIRTAQVPLTPLLKDLQPHLPAPLSAALNGQGTVRRFDVPPPR